MEIITLTRSQLNDTKRHCLTSSRVDVRSRTSHSTVSDQSHEKTKAKNAMNGLNAEALLEKSALKIFRAADQIIRWTMDSDQISEYDN